MHDYVFTTEVIRFAFMFGVAVSMLLYERKHLTTGSIVVPGYIATFLPMPLTIVATFANALITYYLVNKVLRRWFLLYGRTKFTVLASISISIQSLMLQFSPTGSWMWESNIKLFVGVGYVVPALIAHDMGRQGVKKTTKSVLLAGCIVVVPIVLALLFNLPGVNDLAPLKGGGDLAIEVGWIPIAVLLSAGAGWGVARYWGLRSGGFMGAAFVSILLGDPWQVLVTAILAVMTYVLVTRFLMNSMILFGRRKFSAMLLVSSSLSWVLLWVGGEIFGLGIQHHMDIGSLALTPLIVPGLLANDAQRTTPLRVLGGLALATAFVLSTTWWIQSIVEDRPLDLGWKLTTIGTTLAIFCRGIAALIRTKLTARFAALRPAAADTAPSDEHEAWYEWAFASYRKWSALHRDAAEAAERWLGAVLGEAHPGLVIAGVPAAGHLSFSAHESTPARRDGTSARASATTTDTTVTTAAAPTTVQRLRAAALRALDTPTRTAHEAVVLPVRKRPLPTRRPGGQRRGEFDAVGIDVAAHAGRPLAAGHDTPALVPDMWAPAVVHPDAAAVAAVAHSSRPSLLATGAPISEPSDAATTRAHQRAASDARGTSTNHRDATDEEAGITAYPG